MDELFKILAEELEGKRSDISDIINGILHGTITTREEIKSTIEHRYILADVPKIKGVSKQRIQIEYDTLTTEIYYIDPTDTVCKTCVNHRYED